MPPPLLLAPLGPQIALLSLPWQRLQQPLLLLLPQEPRVALLSQLFALLPLIEHAASDLVLLRPAAVLAVLPLRVVPLPVRVLLAVLPPFLPPRVVRPSRLPALSLVLTPVLS